MLDIEVVDDYIISMHQQMNIDKGATTAKKKKEITLYTIAKTFLPKSLIYTV